MPNDPHQFSPFSMDQIRVEPNRNSLVSGDREIRLEPRVMDVLCVLAGSPDRVFSRGELIETLWPSEFGADESLTRAISLIRKSLREAGAPEPSIETIKKRGYRLLLPVVRDAAAKPGPEPGKNEPGNAPSPPSSRRRTWLAGALVAGAVLLAAFFLRGLPSPPTGSPPQAKPTSVVVLPFESLSTNEDDTYLGAGLAEELLNSLVQLRDLRVVGRASAFAVGNAQLDPKELGERLGAEHIVAGSVRRDGERIRITARLVRTSDGSRVWANRYDLEASGAGAGFGGAALSSDAGCGSSWVSGRGS